MAGVPPLEHHPLFHWCWRSPLAFEHYRTGAVCDALLFLLPPIYLFKWLQRVLNSSHPLCRLLPAQQQLHSLTSTHAAHTSETPLTLFSCLSLLFALMHDGALPAFLCLCNSLHPFVPLALWTLSTHPSGPICSYTSLQSCPHTSVCSLWCS